MRSELRLGFHEIPSTACEGCSFLENGACTVPGRVCWKRGIEGLPGATVESILGSLGIWERWGKPESECEPGGSIEVRG